MIMALSVVDLYRDILPKTNCNECGFPTCLAFASMVVSEKLPIGNCPHLSEETVRKCKKELEEQYAKGKWLKKDMAQDAHDWAKEKAASMKLEDLPERIGGELITANGSICLKLPYFLDNVLISEKDIITESGNQISRYEKVFIYNHMAQGGKSSPTGKWKGLVEFPNTVSKMKSMIDHIEIPMSNRFKGNSLKLAEIGKRMGGKNITSENESADVALLFQPLPKVPVMIVFWDEVKEEKLESKIKFLFDETITEHLDIESIMFLSETLKKMLCEEGR